MEIHKTPLNVECAPKDVACEGFWNDGRYPAGGLQGDDPWPSSLRGLHWLSRAVSDMAHGWGYFSEVCCK